MASEQINNKIFWLTILLKKTMEEKYLFYTFKSKLYKSINRFVMVIYKKYLFNHLSNYLNGSILLFIINFFK